MTIRIFYVTSRKRTDVINATMTPMIHVTIPKPFTPYTALCGASVFS